LAVAEYLAAREDPAGELVGPTAQHLLDAVGVAPDPGDSPVVDHAVDLLRVGARRALDLGAPSDALALIARGLGAAGNDGEARAALLHDLAAEAEIYRGNLESAGRHTRQAVVGHHSAAADLAAARTAARFAKALNQHGRNVEALHEIAQPWRDLAERRRTEPASDELDDTYLMVLLRLAGALVWQPPREGFEDLPAAEVAVLEAVTLAERGHDRGELAQALNTLSVHFWLAGAREMAELLIERAAAAARDSGRPADEMFMLLNLAEGLESRDLARFTGICERARQLGQLAPIQASIDGAAVMSAIACWLDGRWTDVPHFLEDNHRTQAWASVAGPAIGAMTAAAMGAMVRDTPSPESVDDPGLRVWLVVAQELGTTSPDADRMLEALRPALTTQGAAEDVWLLWPVAVDAALDTDNLIAADELVQLITVAPASGQTPLGHAQQLRLRGSLDLARGDITSAEDDLRRAVTALDDFGAPFYAARARLSLGRLLADSGRQTEAHAWLQEAGETFHRLGAEPSVQRLRELRVASSTT
jgi:tetratricopeptide (TPR) repeat protein